MPSKFTYSDAQIEAIACPGSMVITACPGSGKTTVIVEKIRQEFNNLKPHQGIIGISFTVKSSKELGDKCKRNGANVRASFFGTIDNFCLAEIVFPFIPRLYGASSQEISCKQYSQLTDEQKTYLPDLSKPDVNLNTSDYDSYELEFIKHYREGFVLLEAVTIIACKIIEKSNACRRYITARYRSVYIDEYQDTSEPQHSLFCALHLLGLKAVAVGDTQQSIFAFRGSNPRHLLSLTLDVTNFEHHIININHRSHPSIVNYANRLYAPYCQLIPVAADDIHVYHRTFNGTQEDVAGNLNNWITKTANILKIENLSEIAILVRWNGSIERLQRNLTIPARFYKDDSLSKIASPAGRFFSALLYFYFDKNRLAEQILEDFPLIKCTPAKLRALRRSIHDLRGLSMDSLPEAFLGVARSFKLPSSLEIELAALKQTIMSSEEILNYESVRSGEVQVMTLHKSKGLEFDLVVHLDLYDWVFPTREYTGNFNDEVFPDWDQDLNLHYVGITRAKKWCVLITSTQRINSENITKSGRASQFLKLPGITALFR
ncbi:TPA: UvrD-helicase domain-containing protein [Pseudomonas aeruginosa]|uniref:UvrD-helicase domain-containing protein n=1 Tax=Stutzerimonas TaxID=2901164 RepID=UPI0018D69407|nr:MULTISPECIES: ATP-dependent helicase [Stutzerimonas]MBH3355182.1 ATP-dependent helicase [Stutzerimonas stutzeri]MCS7622141.1 ATP-dependent helicase [Pseudomonas aeruginosa]MCS7659117.1 ATP-dependent helicase [Pseudomonas aeruginosa]HCE6992487.1 ATP-dependent helicase [Pseudomonas aeruginosa]